MVQNLDSPEQSSALALETLNQVRRRILAHGWSFNTDKVDLAVNNDGRVPLQKSWLKILFPKGIGVRGLNGGIYAWDIKESDWYSKPIRDARVVFDITDFDTIPEQFADWIQHRAACDYWIDRNKMANPTFEQFSVNAEVNAINNEPPVNLNRPAAGVNRGWTWIHVP